MEPPEVYLHQVDNYNIVPSYTSITKTWGGGGARWEFRLLSCVHSDNLRVISFRFRPICVPLGRQLESVLLSAVVCMEQSLNWIDQY